MNGWVLSEDNSLGRYIITLSLLCIDWGRSCWVIYYRNSLSMRFELCRSLSLQFGLHVLKERLVEIFKVDSIWSKGYAPAIADICMG